MLTSVGIAGCLGGDDGSGDDVQDSDGDGVVDSQDYAPNDPEVQEKSDVSGSDTKAASETPTGRSEGNAGDTSTEPSEETATPEPGYSYEVRVSYSGTWQGSYTIVYRGGNTESSSFGDTSTTLDQPGLEISSEAVTISANAQKRDDSSSELTIAIFEGESILQSASTRSSYGVAQVSANVRGESSRTTEPAIEPTFTPIEFVEYLVNTVYNDSEDRLRDESDATRAILTFVHPDRREDVSLGRGLPSPEAVVDDDVTFELIDTEVVEERSSTEVVVAVVYSQGGDRVTRRYELRIGPEDEWYVWEVSG